ncbi:Uncharacterized protein BM_BM12088 [Brugia malayi]|uniref:Bm9072 n=2 Tax=Brugia malayi TaxID=6279 RepID=A0A4E9FXM5_BRUMA|nr:Uncharacterized protein BM_BM12088 [Brugia malayi]VIO99353.1 Uncharacterized protein BM_BM12088 [Brugia malayi]
MIDEMERALDATDHFLDTILQNKNRLEDPNFMIHLMRIRQKHKKTFAVIDKVCNLSHSSKSVASIKICRTDIIDQQCCVLSNSCNCVHANHGKDSYRRSRSMQSVLQTQKQRICEERNNRKSTRSSYSWRFMNELMEKKKVEEMREKEEIMYLRNRAREVPRSTYEPRYQQLREKEEQARQTRHQKAMEILGKVRFPAVSANLAPESFHLRRCISAEASEWSKREAFKAKDVPLSVYVPSYKHEIEAYKRARRKTERAAELIRTSRAPAGLEKHAMQSKVQHHLRHGKYCVNHEKKRNVCYSRNVPNFKKLHEQLLNKLEKAAANRPITVVTPFCFQTDQRIQTHKCNNQILSPRIHRRSYSLGNLREYNGPGIRLNHASLLRNEANRIRVEKMESERNCSRKYWELMRKRNELARIKLKQKLATEVTVIRDIQRRLKEKKLKQQERADEYRNELKAMKRRVEARALIVEQQEMLIKMQRFERKYKASITETRNKTRKVSIQSDYPNRLLTTNSDQLSMISALDQNRNGLQTSKTKVSGDSLFILGRMDKEEECDKENDDTGDSDSDNDEYDTDYDDDEIGGNDDHGNNGDDGDDDDDDNDDGDDDNGDDNDDGDDDNGDDNDDGDDDDDDDNDGDDDNDDSDGGSMNDSIDETFISEPKSSEISEDS